MLVVGVALVLLVLFAPRGLLGLVRERAWGWLP
jgi:branched-chain amino acid transport system permease protein